MFQMSLMPPWDNGALSCSSLLSYSGGQDSRYAPRCPGEDPGLAVPLENSQTREGHGDDVLSCKDAIIDGMIEYLTRMWAHSHLQCDGNAECPCTLLQSRIGSSCCGTTLQRLPIPHMSSQAFILQSRCLSKTKAAWILSVFSGMVQHFTQWLYILAGSKDSISAQT